jgi:hypothetical protein
MLSSLFTKGMVVTKMKKCNSSKNIYINNNYHRPTAYIRDEKGNISLKTEIHTSSYWDNLEPELV